MSIEVHGLTKVFETGRRRSQRRVEAVRDISFSVESGERVAYIGPNGAGKSTSIKILTGILHPTRGEATVLGVVPWLDRRRLAARIGTLFGQRSLVVVRADAAPVVPHARRDLRTRSRDASTPRIGELAELLEAGDLFDLPVRALSLGQRMRCELAACMLHEPEVLFLDEPTIGLDLLAKQRFRELLVRLNTERGTTIFLTSHDVADIEHVARRAIVINHGVGDLRRRGRRHATRPARDEARRGRSGRSRRDRPFWPASRCSSTRDTDDAAGRRHDAHVDPRRCSTRSSTAQPSSDISVVDPPLEQVIAEIYELPQP